MSKTPTERVRDYDQTQQDRGLVRVAVYIPDTPKDRSGIQKSAKRLRKAADLPLPRD